MTKLKIDIKNGLIEVEGEEAFVREIYSIHSESLQSNNHKLKYEPSGVQQPTLATSETEPGSLAKKGVSAKRAGKRKESYSMVNSLDLSTTGVKEGLKDFFVKKSPKTAMKKNVVIVYYLQKIANVKEIGADHVYTCYKYLGEKVPGALRQSLLDTSSKKGWIDTGSTNDITVSTLGENLVDHDLPESGEDK